MVLGLTEDTPLQEYKINGRSVWVKRDDLMGDGVNLAPWGKMAAIYRLVDKYVDKSKPLTHLSIHIHQSLLVVLLVITIVHHHQTYTDTYYLHDLLCFLDTTNW